MKELKMTDRFENPEDVIKLVRKYALRTSVAFVALAAVNSSYFVVDPTERVGVRMWGNVTTKEPLQPGLHFKVPFFTSVDRLVVSQNKVHVEPFAVNTVDNQPISLDINILYRTPDNAVFKNLYEIGKVGADDIGPQLISVVRDQVSRIIASKNTITISANREAIQAEITQHVHDTLMQLFGVKMESLQIAEIKFSQAFMASNELAVRSKNDAVAEENKKRVIEFQQQQQVLIAEGQAKVQTTQADATAKAVFIAAEGQAKAQLAQARATAESAVIAATAQKTATTLAGEGEAARLKAVADAFGGAPNYLESLRISAASKWNGSVPSTVMTMGGGNTPFMFNMPVPGTTNK